MLSLRSSLGSLFEDLSIYFTLVDLNNFDTKSHE